MNAWLCNPLQYPIQGHPVFGNWRTANPHGAGNIPLLGDAQWVDTWPHHSDEPPTYDGEPPWSSNNQMGRVCMNRHTGYVCWVFLDGHARTVGLKELWKLKWSRVSDPDGGPTPQEWPDWMQEFPEY